MSKRNEQEQRAIFLAAVCGQTYTQFSNIDGVFVIPLDYQLCHPIEAQSFNNVWERFGFILESPQEIIIAFGEPVRRPIGYPTSSLHRNGSNILKKTLSPIVASPTFILQLGMASSLRSPSYLPTRPYTLRATASVQRSPPYVP